MHRHMLLRICKILWSNANVLTMVNIIPHMVDNVCTVCTYGKRWHDESDEGWDVVGAVLWLIWLEASKSNSACHQPVRLPTPTSPCPGGYSEIAFVLIPMKNTENLEKSTRMLCFTMQNPYCLWFSLFSFEIRKTRALAGLSRLDGEFLLLSVYRPLVTHQAERCHMNEHWSHQFNLFVHYVFTFENFEKTCFPNTRFLDS